jgi:aconitate hydratase
VVPPETGIVHQVNLEYLAKRRLTEGETATTFAYPDTCVGTDSHTTMINGLGVLGWGVGGIEAEAVHARPADLHAHPRGRRLQAHRALPEGATATDLVLTVTQMLRKHGVVEKFVEFYGAGLDRADALADRATIANMAPEYGATMGFFPVDEETLATCDSPAQRRAVALVEAYYEGKGLWRDDGPRAEFTARSSARPRPTVRALARRPEAPAGPRRLCGEMKGSFGSCLSRTRLRPAGRPRCHGRRVQGRALRARPRRVSSPRSPRAPTPATRGDARRRPGGQEGRGARPEGQALGEDLAGARLARGHRLPRQGRPHRGARGVGFYTCRLRLHDLHRQLGPAVRARSEAIEKGNLVATAVLSGNRNFEGRVSPHVKANYLASPPLVVAYALAGHGRHRPHQEPIGKGSDGQDVYLRDVWPTQRRDRRADGPSSRASSSAALRGRLPKARAWQAIDAPSGDLFAGRSPTYIQEPPFFVDMPRTPDAHPADHGRARAGKLGDSVTTDHISPAGVIGRTARRRGTSRQGRREGRLQQLRLAPRQRPRDDARHLRQHPHQEPARPGTEGGSPTYLGPNDDPGPVPVAPTTTVSRATSSAIYDASVKYQQHRVPLVVLAGKDYGMGSRATGRPRAPSCSA